MESTRETFEKHYQDWKAYIGNDMVALASSDEVYTQNPYFRAIVDMGREALPYLIEKLRTDQDAHFLIHALAEITNRRFTQEEIEQAEARYGEPLGNQQYVAMWLEWWDDHQTENNESNST